MKTSSFSKANQEWQHVGSAWFEYFQRFPHKDFIVCRITPSPFYLLFIVFVLLVQTGPILHRSYLLGSYARWTVWWMGCVWVSSLRTPVNTLLTTRRKWRCVWVREALHQWTEMDGWKYFGFIWKQWAGGSVVHLKMATFNVVICQKGSSWRNQEEIYLCLEFQQNEIKITTVLFKRGKSEFDTILILRKKNKNKVHAQ